jgi:deazaflavin-dependent oxidoreductase (nitroreductase family)
MFPPAFRSGAGFPAGLAAYGNTRALSAETFAAQYAPVVAELKYKRPGWLTRNVFNRMVRVLSRLGIGVAGAETLAVRGRKSGQIRTNPVNPFELDGRTFLLAPRGTTEWVRNMRAAGEGELRKGSGARRFQARELPDSEKLPLLRYYLDRWAWEAKDFLGVRKGASDEELREIAHENPAFELKFEN